MTEITVDTRPDNTETAFDESILRALRRVIRAVDLYSRQLSVRHNLTGPQLVCLRQLARSGGMTPGHLAREISLSPATISGILDRLEKRGYITRNRRPEDKRQVLVALTDAGRALIERTPLPLQERFTQRLAELPLERQAEINEALQQVVTMMEAEELDAAPLLASWPTPADSQRVQPVSAARAIGGATVSEESGEEPNVHSRA
ncbi:MarR family winged helix-turn-helix transcriptional regulator [Natronospira bacteriovora]|uniref:MarR family transcriptional regulator n=1 Tax=Natronospira bacteriovora TaxID=3069753 RepID=A0ABU0W9H7_9GAMM|nr:MarR family transcriptional regulator [Natronospira sp. AB-CW4]MDQ2070559.1 MarR family transcriptional regulator [Natronospira sp. AB-CW4]